MLAAKPGTGTTGSHIKISPHHHVMIFLGQGAAESESVWFRIFFERFGSPNSGFGTL